MSTAKRKHPTFRRFPWLPIELRLEIWKHALPIVTDRATLYPWVKKTEWKYAWEKFDRNYSAFYWPSSPDSNQIAMPLLYVSHESRSVALDWLNKHRPLRKRFRHKGTYLLTRPFIPVIDTLYLANAWFDPTSPNCYPWLKHQPEIMNVAVSESVIMAGQASLYHLVNYFSDIRSISIVVGDGPAPYTSDLPRKEKMTERWEIDGPRETILKWEDRRGEAMVWNPNGMISAPLYTLVVSVYPQLCRAVARRLWSRRNLTIIEAVRAVRR